MSTEFSRLKVRLNKFTSIMGGLLFLMPLILILIDGQVRESISNYAYMVDNEWFFALMSIAGAVFIMDGSIWNKRWYNIVLGCALIGIAVTPHEDSTLISILHYIFAAIFFLGSVFTMIFYSSKNQRPLKIMLAVVIAVGMSLHFLIPSTGLFWAEWIGMVPITFHFLGEAYGKLD